MTCAFQCVIITQKVGEKIQWASPFLRKRIGTRGSVSPITRRTPGKIIGSPMRTATTGWSSSTSITGSSPSSSASAKSGRRSRSIPTTICSSMSISSTPSEQARVRRRSFPSRSNSCPTRSPRCNTRSAISSDATRASPPSFRRNSASSASPIRATSSPSSPRHQRDAALPRRE